MAPRGYRAVKGSAGTRSKAPEGPELPAICEAVGRRKAEILAWLQDFVRCRSENRLLDGNRSRSAGFSGNRFVARRDGGNPWISSHGCARYSAHRYGVRAGSIRPGGAIFVARWKGIPRGGGGHGRFFFRGTRTLPRFSPTTGRSAGPLSRGWWTAELQAEEQPT